MDEVKEAREERRCDALRPWKGRILEVLKRHPVGMTHMALLIRIGKRTYADSANLDSSLLELTFSGIVKCVIIKGSMVYRYGR